MIGGEPGRVPLGISLDNWLSAPYSQWSFQHVEDFVPTALISRGTGPTAQLPAASAPIAEIPVTSTDGVATTVGAVMATTATDGWAVAHRVLDGGRGVPRRVAGPRPGTCCSR